MTHTNKQDNTQQIVIRRYKYLLINSIIHSSILNKAHHFCLIPKARAFTQTVNDIAKRGVECKIFVRESSGQDAQFINDGIDVVLKKDMHILAAVIDRRILWYGNINFTGGNYPDDNTMRIIEPAIASEIMGYLMEG